MARALPLARSAPCRVQLRGAGATQKPATPRVTSSESYSLRRTKVALVHEKTGKLRACQLLLGHRKLESTVRYLGIEVDDALALSGQVDL